MTAAATEELPPVEELAADLADSSPRVLLGMIARDTEYKRLLERGNGPCGMTYLLDLAQTRIAHYRDMGWESEEDVIQFKGERAPKRKRQARTATACAQAA